MIELIINLINYDRKRKATYYNIITDIISFRYYFK